MKLLVYLAGNLLINGEQFYIHNVNQIEFDFDIKIGQSLDILQYSDSGVFISRRIYNITQEILKGNLFVPDLHHVILNWNFISLSN